MPRSFAKMTIPPVKEDLSPYKLPSPLPQHNQHVEALQNPAELKSLMEPEQECT